MASKIDEAQIEPGRKLNELLSSPLFDPLLKEWDDRIAEAAGRREAWRPGILTDSILAHTDTELKTLRSLRAWIDEEIELGGLELAKKQKADSE